MRTLFSSEGPPLIVCEPDDRLPAKVGLAQTPPYQPEADGLPTHDDEAVPEGRAAEAPADGVLALVCWDHFGGELNGSLRAVGREGNAVGALAWPGAPGSVSWEFCDLSVRQVIER